MKITVCGQLSLIRETDGRLLRGRVSDSEMGNEALHFRLCKFFGWGEPPINWLPLELGNPEPQKPSCSRVWRCLWNSTWKICQRNMFSRGISIIRWIYKNAQYCCWAISHRFSGEGQPFQHGTLVLVSARGWLSDLWSLFSKHSWGKFERDHYANPQVHAKTK